MFTKTNQVCWLLSCYYELELKDICQIFPSILLWISLRLYYTWSKKVLQKLLVVCFDFKSDVYKLALCKPSCNHLRRRGCEFLHYFIYSQQLSRTPRRSFYNTNMLHRRNDIYKNNLSVKLNSKLIKNQCQKCRCGGDHGRASVPGWPSSHVRQVFLECLYRWEDWLKRLPHFGQG